MTTANFAVSGGVFSVHHGEIYSSTHGLRWMHQTGHSEQDWWLANNWTASLLLLCFSDMVSQLSAADCARPETQLLGVDDCSIWELCQS